MDKYWSLISPLLLVLSGMSMAAEPTAKMNCKELQRQSFKSSQLVIDGTASDFAGQSLSYRWKVNGFDFGNTASINYRTGSAQTDYFAELCLMDGSNEVDCTICNVELNFVDQLTDCSGDYQTCQSNYVDGNLPKNMFLTNDDQNLYILLEYCSAEAFESDQYLYFDLVPNYGVFGGMDTRFVITHHRPELSALRSMKIARESWNGSDWVLMYEAYPKDGQPVFDMNNTEAQGKVIDPAEGPQMNPLGEIIPENHMIELALPLEGAQSSISYRLSGGAFESAGARTYVLVDQYAEIEVDGFSCDWLGVDCVINPGYSEEFMISTNDWTVTQGIALSENNTDVTGTGPSFEYAPNGGEIHLETSMKWEDGPTGASAILVDVKLPNENWWVGTVRLELLSSSAPWYYDFGNQSISPASLNGEWVTYRFEFDADAFFQVNQGTTLPLTQQSFVDFRLGVNVNPNGNLGKVLVDNFRFEKGGVQ